MFILRIEKVFIPTVQSENGILEDLLASSYIGFVVEVIGETNVAKATHSKYVGMEFVIIEKATVSSAGFYRDDIVSVSARFLTRDLSEYQWTHWKNHPKIFINNANESVMNHYESWEDNTNVTPNEA